MPETSDEAWRLNALRAQIDAEIAIDHDLHASSHDLVSLKAIFRMEKPTNNDKILESYIMLHEGIEKLENFSSTNCDQSLIVKRSKLIFNDRECLVFNFQDISAFKRLKHEQEKSRLMGLLCSSVHHEILGPLQTIIEASVRLIRCLDDQNTREQAQIILICSKQALLFANDILDKKLLQSGRFSASYSQGSVYQTLFEILRIKSLSMVNRNVTLFFDCDQPRLEYPQLLFDKRRLQQVLQNILENAIKFTRNGKIAITAKVVKTG